MNRINIYVKGITSNSVVCYLIRDNQETEAKIAARLKVDETVHNHLMKNLTTPYQTVYVENGTIIGVDTTTGTVGHLVVETMQDYILKLLREESPMPKKVLHDKVKRKYPVSDKTIQRELSDMYKLNRTIIMDTRNVWVKV